MHLVEFHRNRELLFETPRDVPLKFPLDREKLHEQLDTILKDSGDLLSERDSKELLATYGIPVTLPQAASTAEEASVIANEIGYPVVLKNATSRSRAQDGCRWRRFEFDERSRGADRV